MPAAWEGAPARSDAAGNDIIGQNRHPCAIRYKNFRFATHQRNSRSNTTADQTQQPTTNSRSADQLPPDALDSTGRAVAGIHLANHRVDVIAGGGFSDVKRLADFSVRKTVADQPKHIVFTGRQRSHDCEGSN